MTEWVLDEDAIGDGKAYIQWKGTNVCMDMTCLKCGRRIHVDDYFAYNVRCAHCDQVHEMHSFVAYRAVDDSSGATVYGDDGQSKWYVESDGPHGIGTYPPDAPNLPDAVKAALVETGRGRLPGQVWVALCDCGQGAVGSSEEAARQALPCWEEL